MTDPNATSMVTIDRLQLIQIFHLAKCENPQSDDKHDVKLIDHRNLSSNEDELVYE